jgi:nickel-dependent lactate racemase
VHGTFPAYLSADDIRTRTEAGLASLPIDGRRVLVIVPDGTRTMPMPVMFTLIRDFLAPRVTALDYLVALGTHPLMNDTQLGRLVGQPVVDGRVGASRIFNHRWDDPSTFALLGTIPRGEIETLTEGRLSADVPVALNRLVLEYDHVLICGPVFPHEVAGFSGGTKYLFPGIAAPEIIHFTHWLGALITNFDVIGTMDTPVRAVIDRAASLLPTPLSLLALVVTHEGVVEVSCGSVSRAWREAAHCSAHTHVRWLERPLTRVLSVMPEMYDDLWVAAKGAYKMEPAMADGGEIIIYAPHVKTVSHVHGALIEQIGYHCRDYFLKQWDRFGHYPGGILAHATHVKGLGTYDAATGIETPRITVTLATGIPADVCRRINLGYLDPEHVDPADWPEEVEHGRLKVPRAGELLYRLGTPPGPA